MNHLKPEKLIYEKLLGDIQSILKTQEIKSAKIANLIRVQTYWLIGERIYRDILSHKERALYGKQVIVLLAQDLKHSTTQLRKMTQFYKFYPVMQSISPQLSWGHYCELTSIKTTSIRSFYETRTISNKWSIRELRNRIKQNEFEKSLHHEQRPSISLKIPSVYEVIKESYNFSFLNLSKNFTEQEMEQSLLNHIGSFLMELGYGFTFVGSQYKIYIANQIHRIDLLFFHIPLCCYVIVDLKIEKFCDRFVGQMSKYLTYFREQECFPYMKDPIGLIICKEKNKDEVHYALGKLSKEIFVAEYKQCLPEEMVLKKHLNKLNAHKINLRTRQTEALKHFSSKENFTACEYQKVAKVSISTAHRDINILLEYKKIVRHQCGKNVVYSVLS